MLALFYIWIFGSPILMLLGLIMACFKQTRKNGLVILLIGLAIALIGASVCGAMCG